MNIVIWRQRSGFRVGRSTTDHLFTISQVIEEKLFNQEVHLLFINLRRAYESVPQNKLWEALETTISIKE